MNLDITEMNEYADEATVLLKTLAHPVRLIICCQLRDKELSVGDMEERLGIKQPRLSRELAKLREEGFVETRRESKVIFYNLADTPRVRAMIDAVCAVMLGQPVPSIKAQNSQAHTPPVGGCGVFARTQSLIKPNINGGI